MCAVCGAKSLADHVKGCVHLSCLRVAAFPSLLDDNGIDWKDNLIRKLQAENLEIRLELSKTSDGETK